MTHLGNMPAFVQTLNSFGQLEELDIIRFDLHPSLSLKIDFELNLPMLISLRLEDLYEIGNLTLTPRDCGKANS